MYVCDSRWPVDLTMLLLVCSVNNCVLLLTE